MKLKTLLKGYMYHGPEQGMDIEIRGINHDSRHVRPGEVYVCLEGLRVDGHRFAPNAVNAGAVAVVATRPMELGIPVIVVEDTRHALSYFSARYFAHPSRKLHVVGVTGTNGKTTTTHFLQSVYREAGRSCAVIGTVGIKVGEDYQPAGMTTPEAFDLQRTLFEMVKNNIRDVAMEVSSHALAWRRADHVEFDMGVFTNLSHEHLDFHKDMEDYFLTKVRLFQMLKGEGTQAVVNRDDPYGRRLLKMINVPALSFGFGREADVQGRILQRSTTHTDLAITFSNTTFNVQVHLPGEFNAYNALAAAATALAEGLEPAVVARGINGMQSVPGRFETVNFQQDYNIFIDFAHTPDGLEKVLQTLKAVPHRRLITVFGCPGDRDKTKRPVMGRIAEQYSDVVIVSSDNPGSEDPGEIIVDILAGMSSAPVILPDRQDAVRHALSVAGKGDIVLLAGKGHETYQLIGNRHVPYSDRQAVETYFIS
jgi:UDP-N-acetylmuramoyl-L-alanyl-D-glutamate--2,6-diaminopimelate ligase